MNERSHFPLVQFVHGAVTSSSDALDVQSFAVLGQDFSSSISNTLVNLHVLH
jgi:hypothetical protein